MNVIIIIINNNNIIMMFNLYSAFSVLKDVSK